ncbi:hypothetical protein wCauBTS_13400 [Wolbachia pipientis]|uniref:IS4/Tn5 family transposase DNA-binding protein n=1 Tax=Wolbachia pipientis TaxID=955 RepID=UPI0038B69C39
MSEVSTNVQYTDGLGDKWLERELKHVNLGDTRLNKRLIKTGYCIEGKVSGSINQSCSGWKEAKGAYRLFSNEKLKDKDNLLSQIWEKNPGLEVHSFKNIILR